MRSRSRWCLRHCKRAKKYQRWLFSETFQGLHRFSSLIISYRSQLFHWPFSLFWNNQESISFISHPEAPTINSIFSLSLVFIHQLILITIDTTSVTYGWRAKQERERDTKKAVWLTIWKLIGIFFFREKWACEILWWTGLRLSMRNACVTIFYYVVRRARRLKLLRMWLQNFQFHFFFSCVELLNSFFYI